MKKIICYMITSMVLMSGLVMAEGQGYRNRNDKNHGQNGFNNQHGNNSGQYRNDNRYNRGANNYDRNDRRRDDRNRWYGNKSHQNGLSFNIHYNYNNNHREYSRNERRILSEIKRNDVHINRMERDLRNLMDENGSWNHRYNRRLESKIRDLRFHIENLREENRRLWRLLNRY